MVLLSSSWPAVRAMIDFPGEGRLVEGDRGTAVEDVREVDGLAEAELAGGEPRPSMAVSTTSGPGCDWNAPMSGGLSSGEAALVGGDAGDRGRRRADGRAVGLERDGLGRPAVVAERGQAGVGDVEQVVVGRGQPARAAGADQVVRAGDEAGVGAADVAGGRRSSVLPAMIVSVSVAVGVGALVRIVVQAAADVRVRSCRETVQAMSACRPHVVARRPG